MTDRPIIQINVRKSHIIALMLIILIATTAATVNIRDTTNMFQGLNMNNNPITNLQNPTNSQDAATKNYVDNNVGGGGNIENLYVGSPPPEDAENGDVWISNDDYSFTDYLPIWTNQIDGVDGVTAGPNYIYAVSSSGGSNELLKLNKNTGDIVESTSISESTGELQFENNKIYMVGNPSTVYDTSLSKLGSQNWGYGQPSSDGGFYAVSGFTVREYSANLNNVEQSFTLDEIDDYEYMFETEFTVGEEYLTVGVKRGDFNDKETWAIDISSQDQTLIHGEGNGVSHSHYVGNGLILIEFNYDSFDGSTQLGAFDDNGNELWSISKPAGRSSTFDKAFITDDRRFLYAQFSGRVFAYKFGDSPPEDLSTVSKPSQIWSGLGYRNSVSAIDGKDLISKEVSKIAGGRQQEYASLGNTGLGEVKVLKNGDWK